MKKMKLPENKTMDNKKLEAIESVIRIQEADGNWNYDPYMHGLLHGMLIIEAILLDKEYDPYDAPEEWLSDKKDKNMLGSEGIENALTLKIKRLSEDAKLPIQATSGSGCWDVYASSSPVFYDRFVEYSTGLAFELPEGYDMLIFPRSSVSKTDLILANGVGFLDNDYRGELRFRFKVINNGDGKPVMYQKGDRIGQIMLVQNNSFVLQEVEELSDTNRGTGGFGSTGK